MAQVLLTSAEKSSPVFSDDIELWMCFGHLRGIKEKANTSVFHFFHNTEW